MSDSVKLVLDGNMLAWANHCSLGHLSNSKGESTGAFFGTLKQIRSFVTQFKPTEVIACWDSGKTWRNDVYPEYKGTRTGEDKPRLYTQMTELRQALHFLGVVNTMAGGFEADDIAAWFAHRADSKMILVTTDRDWFQLVSDNVSVYEPKIKKLIMKENFQEFTGCPDASAFVIQKALLGDDSDNIPGAPGIGPKKTKQFIEGSAPANVLQQINEYLNSDIGVRAISLLNLGHEKISLDDIYVQAKTFDPEAFYSIVRPYEAKSLLEPLWLQPFYSLIPKP